MGNCTKPQSFTLPEIANIPDYKFEKVSSKPDLYLKKLEHDYNLFRHFDLHEFLFIINSFQFNGFKISKVSSPEKEEEEESRLVEIDKDQFKYLLETKIIASLLVSRVLSENDKAANAFSLYYNTLFDMMVKGQKNYLKQEGKKDFSTNIDKKFLTAFGILFCAGSNRSKVRVIFNTFANDLNILEKKNDDLDLYIYFMVFLSSIGPFLTINKIKNSLYEKDLPVLSEDDYRKMFEDYSVKNTISLTNYIMDKLFEESNELDFEHFEKKSLEHNWFYSLSGNRFKIDDLNTITQE